MFAFTPERRETRCGREVTGASAGIPSVTPATQSQQRFARKVITRDPERKMVSSATMWFETELMTASDWKAKWIRRRDPLAEKELDAIPWIRLYGADAMHVTSVTPAHFRFEFRVEESPSAGSLNVLARSAFLARVNGQTTGHHDRWGRSTAKKSVRCRSPARTLQRRPASEQGESRCAPGTKSWRVDG